MALPALRRVGWLTILVVPLLHCVAHGAGGLSLQPAVLEGVPRFLQGDRLLDPETSRSYKNFGVSSVFLGNGSVLAVGASSIDRVFLFSPAGGEVSGAWQYKSSILPDPAVPSGSSVGFGRSMVTFGDTLIVGHNQDFTVGRWVGAVRVYAPTVAGDLGGTWSGTQLLLPPDNIEGLSFGYAPCDYFVLVHSGFGSWVLCCVGVVLVRAQR